MKWTQLWSSLNILCHYPSLGLKWKHLFQSSGHCWVFKFASFQISLLTASSFRIWNSSAGIPSPPLALFVVMLPKAHLTSDSRTSGSSRWVITLSWLSGSWRSFLYSSSVYMILVWISFFYMYLKCIFCEWMGEWLNNVSFTWKMILLLKKYLFFKKPSKYFLFLCKPLRKHY